MVITNESTLAIIKSEQLGLTISLSECIYTVDHFLRHWKWRPLPAGNQSSRLEIQKLVGPLQVASRSKTDCTNCSSSLVVSWAGFLMRLNIRTKWKLAVLLKVKLHSCHDSAGSDRVRDAALGRKNVQPHGRVVN